MGDFGGGRYRLCRETGELKTSCLVRRTKRNGIQLGPEGTQGRNKHVKQLNMTYQQV